MTETVFVGGWGSSPNQCTDLARTMTESSGVDTMGICFREAYEDIERLADVTDGKTILTNSAGSFAIAGAHAVGARFSQMTAFAPVNPEKAADLMKRGAAIGLHDPAAAEEIRDKVADSGNRMELLLHPRTNFGAIPKLAEFCTLDFLMTLAEENVPTRVAFMENDGLFNLSHVSPDTLKRAQALGVEVCMISGSHNRFGRDPLGVLSELNDASDFDPLQISPALASIKEAVKFSTNRMTAGARKTVVSLALRAERVWPRAA